MKWLDIQKAGEAPGLKLKLRTKNPPPNPAIPHPSPIFPNRSVNLSNAEAAARFQSPTVVIAGKKVETKNLDFTAMQKVSAMLVEAALAATTVEMTKDDYDILMEFFKLFSSDEEGVMTNIDVSISEGTLDMR